MQAVTPLGVDDVTRIEIENSICREGGPLPDCFELPMENVLCLLEEVCLTLDKVTLLIVWPFEIFQLFKGKKYIQGSCAS